MTAHADYDVLLISDVGVVPDAGGPYSIKEGDSLTLDASQTANPNNLPLSYSWDINGDGVFGDATGETPMVSWQTLQNLGISSANSPYSVRVQVDLGAGSPIDSAPTTLVYLAPPTNLAVTAQGFDADQAPKVFGTYLPSVGLDVPFTVTATDPAHLIAKVKWSIDGDHPIQAESAGTGMWTFKYNPGVFDTAGTHTLTVTAYDRQNRQVGESFEGQIVVGGQPDFELKAGPTGQGAPVNVEDLRFLRDISAAITFTGTLDGVPEFYKNQLSFKLGGTSLPTSAFLLTDPDSFQFQFNADPTTFPKPNSNLINADVFIGNKRVVQLGDAPEQLFAINIPDWIQNGERTFNPSTASYEITGAVIPVVSVDYPAPKTGMAFLDKQLKDKTSFVHIQPVLNIVAPLNVHQPVTFDTSELKAMAQVLGEEVWNETYKSDDLAFGGTLDSRTLEANGLSIRLKQPKTLATKTFVDTTFTINLLPRIPSDLAKADVTLHLKLEGVLTGDAGIQFSSKGGKVKLEKGKEGTRGGTFVSLTGTATGAANADLAANVLAGYLAEGTGHIGINGKLTLVGEVRFSSQYGSPIGIPKPTSGQLSALFDASYNYVVEGTLFKTYKVVDLDSKGPKSLTGNMPIELFKLKT